MALVIKKPVDLSSLGDEYSGISLVFRSIPARDLGVLQKKQEEIEVDDKGNPDAEKTLQLFIEILQKYFLEGKQGEEKIVKEDIANLDTDALTHCFQIITGVTIDPKAENSSTSTSSTEAPSA